VSSSAAHAVAAVVSPKASRATAQAAASSPSCTLPDNRDVYVWYKVPGTQDSAQELGEADLANCTTTVENIVSTAPTGAGYCTQIGWVDQNSGYNANADVASPIPNIIDEVGGSC
jgi:hypothetical protein